MYLITPVGNINIIKYSIHVLYYIVPKLILIIPKLNV